MSRGSNVSKAALIKQGDAICTETDRRQRMALKAYETDKAVKPTTQADIEETLRVVALPPIASEIEELQALGAPAGEEAGVEAILSGLRQALKTAEAEPSTLMGSESAEGPFAAPDKLAAAYGFKACSKAL